MQLMAQAATTPEALAALRHKLDELEAAAAPPNLAVSASGEIIQLLPKPIKRLTAETIKKLSKKKRWTRSELTDAVNIFKRHLPASMILHFKEKNII
jgi:hypothetical protein